MDAVIAILKNVDTSLFIITDFGAQSMSLNATKLVDFIETQAKYEKGIFIGGGGSTSTSQLKGLSGQNSQNIAAYFNSDKVIVCHGGTKKSLPGEEVAERKSKS
jgi:hypothetical protein